MRLIAKEFLVLVCVMLWAFLAWIDCGGPWITGNRRDAYISTAIFTVLVVAIVLFL